MAAFQATALDHYATLPSRIKINKLPKSLFILTYITALG
jgi:hypothetical protein